MVGRACMDEMGVIMPPKLQPKARPSSRHLVKGESGGKSRMMGSMIDRHSTGAVWLLITAE